MTPIWTHIALTVGGFVLLSIGAEGLVRGASALALRWNVSPLVVGLTIVAFGTSAPELVVCAQASFKGQGAIAMGNVIGSNIVNIGLILGLAAFLTPLTVHAQVIRKEVPAMFLVTAVFVLLAPLGEVGMAAGILLVLMLVAYLAYAIFNARHSKDPTLDAEFKESLECAAQQPLYKDWLYLLGGMVLLAVGSEWMVEGACGLARAMGVSELVIGLTVVAIGTSLPELATCVVAAIKRESDVAVGNIIGSNIFNIAGILGIAAMVNPISFLGLHWLDYTALITLTLLCLPIMRSGFLVSRREGLFLMVLYFAYLGIRFA